MTFQMLPHHWVISLATRLGVCQANVSSNRMLKPQQTKTLIPVIIWLLSNLPLSAAWKEIGLSFKILLSRNKLTCESIEGLIWMQADMGLQKSSTCWEIKEASEAGKLLIARTQRTDRSKPSWISQGGEGGCSAPWGGRGIWESPFALGEFHPSFCFQPRFWVYLGPPNPKPAQGSVMWIRFWAFHLPGWASDLPSQWPRTTDRDEGSVPKTIVKRYMSQPPLQRALPALDPPWVRTEAYTM